VAEISQNIAYIRQRIAEAAERAGRRAEEIEIVAVTKTVPPEKIRQALAAGITILGENRVQEAKEKIAALGRDAAAWHLIGHLQTNKAKAAAELFACVQSLDSLRLAAELDRRAAACGRRLPVLVQVNIGREETKFGVEPDEVLDFLLRLAGFSHLEVQGLMAIPPLTLRPEEARGYFRRMAELFRQATGLGLPGMEMRYLSMGMSQDFEVAIEEGANMVRLGTAIFGPRNK